MRKSFMWLLGLLVLASGALSVFWHAYAPTARAQIVEMIETADAQGVEASFGDLSIEGFPFAYEGRFTDLSIKSERDGYVIELPEASGRVSPLAPNQVKLFFPETFTGSRIVDGETAGLNFSSESLVATLTRIDDGSLGYQIEADQFRADPTTPDPNNDYLELTAPRLNGAIRHDPDAAPISMTLDLEAKAFLSKVTLANSEGAATPLTLSGETLDLTADATEAKFASQLSIGQGKIDSFSEEPMTTTLEDLALDLTIAPETLFDVEYLLSHHNENDGERKSALVRLAELLMKTLLEGGGVDATMTLARYETDTTITAQELPFSRTESSGVDNTVKVSFSKDAGVIDMQSGEATFSTEGDLALAGRFGVSSMTFDYPLRAAVDVVQPARFTYQIADISLTDETWSVIDPEQAFSREPSGVTINAEAGLELQEDFFSLSKDQDVTEANTAGASSQSEADRQAQASADQESVDGDPAKEESAFSAVRLRSLELSEFALQFLGLGVDASGTVDIVDASANGGFDITLMNWRSFLDNIGKSGIVEPDKILFPRMMLEGMSRPVDETTSTIRLDFTDGAMAVNGQPIGQQ